MPLFRQKGFLSIFLSGSLVAPKTQKQLSNYYFKIRKWTYTSVQTSYFDSMWFFSSVVFRSENEDAFFFDSAMPLHQRGDERMDGIAVIDTFSILDLKKQI